MFHNTHIFSSSHSDSTQACWKDRDIVPIGHSDCWVPRNRVPKEGSKASQRHPRTGRPACQGAWREGPKGHLGTTRQVDRPTEQMFAEQPSEADCRTTCSLSFLARRDCQPTCPSSNPARRGYQATGPPSNSARRQLTLSKS